MRARLRLAAAFARWADPARAAEVRRVVVPLGADVAPAQAEAALPEAWIMGDAVAVLAGPRRPARRAALLEACAAVIEPREGGADLLPAAAPGDAPLARALEAARGQLGARLVVALGAGPAWGEAALEARHLGFAAAAALEERAGAPPRVRPGPPPPLTQRWDLRAPLFCDALARAGGARVAA